MLQKKILPVLFFLLASCFLGPALSAAKTITILRADGVSKKAQMESVGKTEYIAIQSAALLYQGKIQWHAVSKKADLWINKQKLKFSPNSRTVMLGKKKQRLDSPTQLIKDDLYIPLSFFLSKEFAQATQMTTLWDSQKRILKTAMPTNLPAPDLQKSTPNGKLKKIVVDAGHGGKDPGTTGRLRTREKDINLSIALELAEALEEEGYEVVLTRKDDTFISLSGRSDLANAEKADLFVSIHCNASFERGKRGFEIYYLANNASDAHAAETEELENSVIQLEGEKTEAQEKLHKLLFSMAKNEFINESSLLCRSIVDEVKNNVDVKSRDIKQANFHVLHGAQMPAVLIENGYLSNASEEKKLRQKKYRSQLVAAFVAGIQTYETKLDLLQKSNRQ